MSLLVLALTMCVSLFTGCKDDFVDADQTMLYFDQKGGSQTVQITSNSGWYVECSESWVRCTPTESKKDHKLNVSVNANDGLAERTASVKVFTDDGKDICIIDIKQSGADAVLTVNGNNETALEYSANANESQSVSIYSNGTWSLDSNTVPDWLRVSPSTGGAGSTSLIITTTSANETAETRVARLELHNGSTNASVEVKQASGKSGVYIKPKDWVSIFDEYFELYEFAWEYTAIDGKEKINNFRYLVLPESDVKNWTKLEVKKALEEEELLKYSLEYISVIAWDSNGDALKGNTSYRFYSIAYDESGNEGVIHEETMKTPTRLDATADAYVNYSSIGWGSDGFQFTANLQARAKKYDIIYGNLDPQRLYLGALFAYQLEYYKKYKKKHWFAEGWQLDVETDYPNTHKFVYYTYYMSEYPLVSIWGRGIFENNQSSTCITGLLFDWTEMDNDSQRRNISGGKTSKKVKQLPYKKSYDYTRR